LWVSEKSAFLAFGNYVFSCKVVLWISATLIQWNSQKKSAGIRKNGAVKFNLIYIRDIQSFETK